MSRTQSNKRSRWAFAKAWLGAMVMLLCLGCEPKPLPYLISDELVLASGDVHSCGVTVLKRSGDTFDLAAYFTNFYQPQLNSWHCEVSVVDTARVVVAQFALHTPISSMYARDITGDGKDELLIFFKDDSTASVIFYELQDDGLDSLGAFTVYERDFRWRGYTNWDAEFTLGCAIPPDSAGRSRVLLLLGADYGKLPRGMIMIDPLAGR